MPWIIGLGGFQPYPRGEIQEKLREHFWGLSGISPGFLPESPRCWEKETIHRPAPVQNFSLQKKWGPQRKDFGGGYGFSGFHRVSVSTTGLESLSMRPEKFSKRFSFGGGCVRFLLLCFPPRLFMCHKTSQIVMKHCKIYHKASWPPSRENITEFWPFLLAVFGISYAMTGIGTRNAFPIRRCPSTVSCTVPSGQSPIFGGFPVENPANKATASTLFYGGFLCPSTVRRGSEYGWEVHPPLKTCFELKIQNTKVASAKVAFDTVREMEKHAKSLYRWFSPINQERKISPKRKFLGRTSRGHPRVVRADIPAQNFGQGGQNRGRKTSFRRGHPWPEGADVHDPKGFPKTSVRKTLGWIFVP